MNSTQNSELFTSTDTFPTIVYSPGTAGNTKIIRATLEFILGFVIVTGNGLVVFLFGRNGRYKKSHNYFIIQLALADFFLGVSLPYQTYNMAYPEVVRQINLCFLGYVLPLFSMGTSIFSLIVLSADRYLAIHRPLTYQDTLTSTFDFLLDLGSFRSPHCSSPFSLE